MSRKEIVVRVVSWSLVIALLFLIEFLSRTEDSPEKRILNIGLFFLVAMFVVFGMPYLNKKMAKKEEVEK
jgi:hypothetical protein